MINPKTILAEWVATLQSLPNLVQALGGNLVFVHEFSLYLRAPENADVGYEDLFNWIVNDIPAGSSLPMLHTNIDPNCEPMDFYLPTAQRNTVVISADGATFEYFEVRVSLIESLNP